ncbi:MAG TPA: permease-like cell division protein FtsX [Mycobacteriales bacterium]|nr:permease-like cell division protein FtsX [Mycobacteriales bacterium]
MLAVATACGGGSSPAKRQVPDLARFLRLPVATPTACGSKVSGSTAGRRSPWVGNVDVSVFLEPSASPTQVASLGDQLRAMPAVKTVYFESAEQAYQEFQRLYTCSADVPRSAVPASYRLVLKAVQRPQRDDLVTRVRGLPAVSSVSCDPSSPCLP